MDNFSPFKLKLMNIYRNYRFKFQNLGRTIYYDEDGNDLLFNQLTYAIEHNIPYLVGRFGACEARTINCYLHNRNYPDYLKERLKTGAGVFFNDCKEIDDFSSIYSNSFKNVDILVTWSIKNSGYLNNKLCPKAKNISFYSIEPWFWKNPWTLSLKNKKVLIIHPFVETMKKQYEEKRGGYSLMKPCLSFLKLIL